MPALSGIEEKYFDGYKVDKENENVIYSDEKHVYIDKESKERCISVTTLISMYHEEFNEEFWTLYKALESLLEQEVWDVVKPKLLANKNADIKFVNKLKLDLAESDIILKQNEIKEEYRIKRETACERGTAIHAKFENSFYNQKQFDFKNYGFEEISGDYVCNKDYYTLDLSKGVYPEFLIACNSQDGVLRLAGQIDLLILNGNDVYIVDFKGLPLNTPIATPSGWKTMSDLKIGDSVFDKNGKIVKVLSKSKIHNNPCFEIAFDNNDKIIADKDHRWEINFKRPNRKGNYRWVPKIMTTEEIKIYLETHPRETYYIPKILNPKPIELPDVKLPIDPYVLGCWLGDGHSSSGMITNCNKSIWKEIQNRGYKIGSDIRGRQEKSCEQHTVYGLRTKLRKLGLLNNKHIPEIYMRSSYEQRLDLLRGLMDTDGYYHKSRKRFVMGTTQKWQCYDFSKLLNTLGVKPTIFKVTKKCSNNNVKTPGYDVTFTTNNFNPFLSRNKNVSNTVIKDNNSYRTIVSVNEVDTVPTQCIEVSGDSHTYLAGHEMIVTHNSNKEIKKTSFYDKKKKSNVMMKFPINNLQDCNFNHYQLQLSTYAFMLQTLRPELNIKKLILYHIDHDGNEMLHECQYLKEEVVRMLNHYKKKLKIKKALDRDKPVIIG